MNKSLISKGIIGVISVIGIILFARLAGAGEALESDADLQASIVDPLLGFAKILLGLVAIVTVVFSLMSLLKNPAALKKTLIGLVILAVLFGIAWATAGDGEVRDKMGEIIKNGEAGSLSKWVSTLINFAGILGLAGIVAIALGPIKSLISK